MSQKILQQKSYCKVAFFLYLHMKKVQLENTDIEITPIIFGGNVFGWTLNEEESFRILDGKIK